MKMYLSKYSFNQIVSAEWGKTPPFLIDTSLTLQRSAEKVVSRYTGMRDMAYKNKTVLSGKRKVDVGDKLISFLPAHCKEIFTDCQMHIKV